MLSKLSLAAALALLCLTSRVTAQDCSVPFLPSEFKARLAWQSGQDGPSTLATPVVANMNPQVDSMPEIIVAEAANGLSNKIQFYRGDGSNLNNPMILTVPGNFDNYPVPGPTVGDVDGDGIPELLMSCNDSRIRVFHNYTENPVAPMQLWITSTGTLDFVDQRPFLADFDGDGIPEVYAGSDIFKFDFSNPAAPTLTKVINGGTNRGRAHYSTYNEGSCNPTAVDILSVADCGGDPDCAGLELVAGPIIYSIDLDLTDGDGYQIKVQRDLNLIANQGTGYSDGYTAVADVDLDGILDVVVTSKRANNQRGMYVWNKTGLKRFFPYPTNVDNSGSLACIANVYDDTKSGYAKDFPEIIVCSSFNLTCFNMQAALANPAAPYWWNLPTTDYSGWTGSSVYDFNGDDIAEIVYRDEENFRILYGGATPFPPGVDAERNWLKIPCYSTTSDEYPVVADLDNDGETEIVLTGRITGGVFFNGRGRLRVFESDGNPWVPSRNLWNQFNYFVVNVNDDLSIPAVQPTHHLELPATGSGKRPLNRYLSQRPVLNDNFETFIPLPDANAQVLQVTCFPDSLGIDLNICNTGDQSLHSSIPIAFYSGDPTLTNAALLGAIQLTDAPVKKDSCKVFHFTVPKISGTIFGVINDNGTTPAPFQLGADFPVTNELECNWLNNIFQFESPSAAPAINLGPDLDACGDTIVLLNAGTGYVGYQWQDGSNGSTFQVQQAGLYWVVATDFCALKHIDSVWVTDFGRPNIQLDTINGDCHGNPASVTASAMGAHLPFAYQWSTGDTSYNLSGLPDGIYTVTVTNAKGCTSTHSTWVEAGGNLEAMATVATPIPCFGQTGVIQVNIVTGKPPYSILWSGGTAAQNQTTAIAGNYSVTVTDADLCVETLQISIEEPSPLLTAGISTTPACPGMANGQAEFLGAQQGTPPYSLLWSTNATTPNQTGLATGAYQLSVTDANGCSLVENTQVSSYSAPIANTALSNATCFGLNNGSIQVDVLGGTPGFGFFWSNNSTTSNIDNLAPGNYALTISYADGACTQTIDYQINEPLPILISATSNPAICNGGSGGGIDLMVQNGAAPLTFLWSNSANTEDLINVETGMYQVMVTDASGCTQTFTQNVAEWPAISLSAADTQPLCAGGSNGALQILAVGGVLPFQVNWSNGATGALLTGLPAGNYTATVTDAAACTEVLALQLGEPTPLLSAGASAAAACPGLANGSASFLGAAQGTPPYTLLWSNNATTANINSLSAGSYQLSVTDANGCLLIESVSVPEFLLPVTDAALSDVRCFGGKNGILSVAVLSGSPGFGFQWSNNATTSSITNLAPGDYSLTLTYANGACAQTFDFQINEPPPIALLEAAVTPALCFGTSTGAIALSVTGGIAPYQFHWADGQQTKDIGNLLAGQYAFTLTDSNGCLFSEMFQVPQPTALAVNTLVQADTCQSSNGSISTMSAGGVPPYQYAWSDASVSANLINLAAGNYALTIMDANGCLHTVPVPVPAYGTIPQISATAGVITCAQPSATVVVAANQGNLHYNWLAPGGALTDQSTHSVLVSGLYRVTVTNDIGCQSATQVQVLEDTAHPMAEAGPPAIKVTCSETEILLDASGSSQGNDFVNRWRRLSNGAVAFDTLAVIIPISKPGLYVHTVLNNANGCLAQDSVLVDWDAPILAAIALDSIRCFGEKGTIHIQQLSGGTPPYYYSIDNLNFKAQNTFPGLFPGEYPVMVRDDHDCWWESSVTLTQPEQLSVTLMASDTALELGRFVYLTALPRPTQTVWKNIVWEPAELGFKPMSLQQQAKPETNTEFIVRIFDQNGCMAEDRLWVNVYNHHIYIPNIIYPGSVENSWFTVFGGEGVREVKLLRVFDRWGNFLFERKEFPVNEPTSGWDGSFRGQALNPGVFAWYAEVVLHDGRVLAFKGDVTVVR